MKIKFEKLSYPAPELPGKSNAKFYSYCMIDGKRFGTVWKFNDGNYVLNEDFDTRKHDKDNRPIQIVAPTLNALRERIKAL